ncbi:MAG: CoA-binding protein [Desulfobacterales bacterium]
MNGANLSRLMNPRAITVIGASNREGAPGKIIFKGLMGSLRRLYPVHPAEKEILGHPAVPSVTLLPPDIDLAVISTNAEEALKSAYDCAKQRIPFIIVVSSGFGEAGQYGIELENKLRDIPERFGSRILGPNSLGIFIPVERLDTLFVEHGDRSLAAGGGIAFVTQSGSVGVEALGLAGNMGFGLRAFVGLGNKCDLDELDFLQYFANDPETDCLAFYLENIEHGMTFLEEAKALAKTKPVVILKAGRTPGGIKAVSSHTGRMAGSDDIINGLFRQYCIIRAADDEELCDAAKTLSMLPLPEGNRVAVVTPAGGFGVICVDYIESSYRGTDLQLAQPAPQTLERIRQKVLPFASMGNPVDLTAGADDAMFGTTLDALLEDDGVDIVICTAFFAPPAVSDRLIDEIAARVRLSKKPIIVFTQYGPFTDLYLKRMHSAGVVGFPSISRAVRAVRILVERRNLLKRLSV